MAWMLNWRFWRRCYSMQKVSKQFAADRCGDAMVKSAEITLGAKIIPPPTCGRPAVLAQMVTGVPPFHKAGPRNSNNNLLRLLFGGPFRRRAAQQTRAIEAKQLFAKEPTMMDVEDRRAELDALSVLRPWQWLREHGDTCASNFLQTQVFALVHDHLNCCRVAFFFKVAESPFVRKPPHTAGCVCSRCIFIKNN